MIKDVKYQPDRFAHDPKWLRDYRERAYSRFQELGFPNRKHEGWKYLSLEEVLGTCLKSDAAPIQEVKTEIPTDVLHAEIEKDRQKAALLGVAISPLNQGGRSLRAGDRGPALEDNVFALMNAFCFEDGVEIYIHQNRKVSKPIVVNLSSFVNGVSQICHPRIEVVLEPGAEAELVFVDAGERLGEGFQNTVVHIDLKEGASLRVNYIQSGAVPLIRFIKWNISLNAQSSLKWGGFYLDSFMTRSDLLVRMLQENAKVDLAAFSLLDGKSRFYQHGRVRHESPTCQSEQVYRTILSGYAQAESNTLVHVAKHAQKTEANQGIRNLMLSETCRAWARPQLHILADDVKCAHGAATGQFDEGELFYLRSRGLSKSQAQFMMMDGMAQEMVQKHGLSVVRSWLRDLCSYKIHEMIREMKG